jgi:ATP-dependent Lhr-like helicase
LGDEQEPVRRRGQLVKTGRARSDPSVQGRWFVLPRAGAEASDAQRRKAWADLLLERHGVLSREALSLEAMSGGFSTIYPVLALLEERGRVRRGYFARGLSGQQFATLPAAERIRRVSSAEQTVVLSATDPANLYGAVLGWPAGEPRPQRAKGAWVILRKGVLLAYVGRGARSVTTFVDDPEATARAIEKELCKAKKRVIEIETVDGSSPRATALGNALQALGFHATERGHLRKSPYDA